MGLLSKVEGVAEIFLTFLFKKSVETLQPVEVAHELLRAMMRHKQISIANVYAPNVYKVSLNGGDYRTINSFGQTYLAELARHLYEEGTKQGYTFLTPPSIRVREASHIPPGKVELEVSFNDQAVATWRPDVEVEEWEAEEVEKTSVLPQEILEKALENQESGRNFETFLEVIEGSDIGRCFSLNQEFLVIGRHAHCNVCLNDEEVSRRHARVFLENRRWILQDLGSTNGTFVNRVRADRYILHAEDQIRLGQTVLSFRMPPPAEDGDDAQASAAPVVR